MVGTIIELITVQRLEDVVEYGGTIVIMKCIKTRLSLWN